MEFAWLSQSACNGRLLISRAADQARAAGAMAKSDFNAVGLKSYVLLLSNSSESSG